MKISQSQADRQADGETDGETDRQTERQTERQTDRETDRWRDRQTDGETDGWTTYTFTRSPFFKVTAASDLSGEKWQTQLFRDTQVGNAIPVNTTAITFTGGIN